MKYFPAGTALIFSLLILASCQPELIIKAPGYDYSAMNKETRKVHQKIEQFLIECRLEPVPIAVHPATRIEFLRIDKQNKELHIGFSKHFSYIPFREVNVQAVYTTLARKLGRKYRDYRLVIKVMDEPLEAYIPNFYRLDTRLHDERRKPAEPRERLSQPIVRRPGWPVPEKGLYNRHIGLWHSHGWYYSHLKDRWEWQRPRLFQTVEDLLPMSFTIPYLIPMLENAGARVFVPRERDLQMHEVIVDNDSMSVETGRYLEKASQETFSWRSGTEPAFAIGRPPYEANVNPFRQGSYRLTLSDSVASAWIEWIPNIPEKGEYAVYVAYHSTPENVEDALYTVHHAGGESRFLVNQQIGGGTWIYLGHFKFLAGWLPDSGKVTLVNKSTMPERTVTADAVRFGGGMGTIMRNGKTSGRPRFVEGSRYYLQFAGMPDTLVYHFNKDSNDYNDDFQSRAEYINYLYGAPYGPNRNRAVAGLGIPMDLSLAFHTDAGISRSDTTIGTLMIYSLDGADTLRVFPDGMSRMANRDLADIMQTQIVQDIKAQFDPFWSRRFLMEARYSEAFRPNVPGVLLELLSHQNFLDMRFAQDPRFRFAVARAIYKAMLKFVSHQYGQDYVVQPLPVTHFQAVFDSLGRIRLRWQPAEDPLEPTALPQKYRLYTRIEDGGFDNGADVDQPHFLIDNPRPGTIYSFKVTAWNQGGESFPSEILSLCKMNDQDPPVLIVNGFDRVSAPATFDSPDLSGFAHFMDQGVADKFDINFTGQQFDFNPQSAFRLNDAPGHGASYGDYETTIIPGNSFDFPYVHGRSIRAAGYSFVSCSDESVADGQINLSDFSIVDWILGEEKKTAWPKVLMDSLHGRSFKTFDTAMQQALRKYVEGGGHLFVTGAYVGSDLFAGKAEKDADAQFAREVLKFWWVTDHAARKGEVFSNDTTLFNTPIQLTFNTRYHPRIYTVEAPDAIGPEEGARVIMRYSENQFSAGIAYAGDYKTVVLGFPFETILSEQERDLLMKSVLDYLSGR